METEPRPATSLAAYRDQRRQNEIDALNFGTKHKPGQLGDRDEIDHWNDRVG